MYSIAEKNSYIASCLFRNNSAVDFGEWCCVVLCVVVIADLPSVLRVNSNSLLQWKFLSVRVGGAVFASDDLLVDLSADTLITGCCFDGNRAALGGGIYTSAPYRVQNCSFVAQVAHAGGELRLYVHPFETHPRNTSST